ncbi:MAG: hypothetical protein ACK5ME_02765 [Parahaliea sp.]
MPSADQHHIDLPEMASIEAVFVCVPGMARSAVTGAVPVQVVLNTDDLAVQSAIGPARVSIGRWNLKEAEGKTLT